ncbi:hypothetical protein HPP92_007317 [Vanilla planifolia]|uniref:Uncharacterized protein n=1 Tax=Vanilla planifolia TaxID=51239 RepID=A0A835RK30_VANPL|nr:hypothetical protein HPP92_007522 [Vanilla planifolia]KAG0490454.1 hypothetical protein HPP92_007317 [Vanilla planifolia]
MNAEWLWLEACEVSGSAGKGSPQSLAGKVLAKGMSQKLNGRSCLGAMKKATDHEQKHSVGPLPSGCLETSDQPSMFTTSLMNNVKDEDRPALCHSWHYGTVLKQERQKLESEHCAVFEIKVPLARTADDRIAGLSLGACGLVNGTSHCGPIHKFERMAALCPGSPDRHWQLATSLPDRRVDETSEPLRVTALSEVVERTKVFTTGTKHKADDKALQLHCNECREAEDDLHEGYCWEKNAEQKSGMKKNWG